MYYINLDNQPTTNIILLLNHCLNLDSIAGVSRSATIAAAYIMSVTSMNWRESLRAIKCARSVTNPNYGFQRQLQDFYNRDVNNVRKKPVFCFLRWKPCLLCLVEQSCTGGGGGYFHVVWEGVWRWVREVLPFARLNFANLWPYTRVKMLNCSWLQSFVRDPVKRDPILDQFSVSTRSYTRLNGLKTVPFSAAHTRIANIWE